METLTPTPEQQQYIITLSDVTGQTPENIYNYYVSCSQSGQCDIDNDIRSFLNAKAYILNGGSDYADYYALSNQHNYPFISEPIFNLLVTAFADIGKSDEEDEEKETQIEQLNAETFFKSLVPSAQTIDVLTDLTTNEAENDAEATLISFYYITQNSSLIRRAYKIINSQLDIEALMDEMSKTFGPTQDPHRNIIYSIYSFYIIELFISSLKTLHKYSNIKRLAIPQDYFAEFEAYLGGDSFALETLFTIDAKHGTSNYSLYVEMATTFQRKIYQILKDNLTPPDIFSITNAAEINKEVQTNVYFIMKKIYLLYSGGVVVLPEMSNDVKNEYYKMLFTNLSMLYPLTEKTFEDIFYIVNGNLETHGYDNKATIETIKTEFLSLYTQKLSEIYATTQQQIDQDPVKQVIQQIAIHDLSLEHGPQFAGAKQTKQTNQDKYVNDILSEMKSIVYRPQNNGMNNLEMRQSLSKNITDSILCATDYFIYTRRLSNKNIVGQFLRLHNNQRFKEVSYACLSLYIINKIPVENLINYLHSKSISNSNSNLQISKENLLPVSQVHKYILQILLPSKRINGRNTKKNINNKNVKIIKLNNNNNNSKQLYRSSRKQIIT